MLINIRAEKMGHYDPRFMTHKFKRAGFSYNMSRGPNFVPATELFHKTGNSPYGNCPCSMPL